MKHTKAFIMIESLVALCLAFLGVSIFSLVVLSGYQEEKRMEQQTDQALARHIMRKNNVKQVKIHDRIYEN